MPAKDTRYTDIMKAKVDREFSDMKSYYSREDLEAALSEFDHAAADARLFCKRRVQDICHACGLNTDQVIADRSLLDHVLTREQLEDHLLDVFHDMYRDFPTSADFMERTVRVLAPEYGDDSVRLAILKKFLAGAGPHFQRFPTDDILEAQSLKLTKLEMQSFRRMNEDQQRAYLISKVDDSIFSPENPDNPDIEFRLGPDDILELIDRCVKKHASSVKNTDWSIDFDDIVLSDETLRLLDDFLRQHDLHPIKPETLSAGNKVKLLADGMKNGNISREEIRGAEDLILAIESDFTQQLSGISRAGKNGKKDTAKSVYMESKKTRKNTLRSRKMRQRRPGSAGAELLKICSDLADGRFRGSKMTREYLYYFAFMFGMRWDPEEEDETDPEGLDDEGKERRTRSNLRTFFQDYYNDNLMRYFTKDYDKDSEIRSSLEKEPSGRGINYKNYKEAIFLWYLSHDELGLCPGEKIDHAILRAKECVDKAGRDLAREEKEEGEREKETWRERQARFAGEPTLIYLDTRIIDLLDIRDEDRIADYVTENFAMPDPNGVNSAQILVASRQNTAMQDMRDLTEAIGEDYPEPDRYVSEMDADAGDMDLAPDEEFLQALRDRYREDPEFLRFLDILDEKLHRSGREEVYTRKCSRMLAVLHILIKYSDRPLSASFIRSRLVREEGIAASDRKLQDALNDLSRLGFDIRSRKLAIRHRDVGEAKGKKEGAAVSSNAETAEKCGKRNNYKSGYYLGSLIYKEHSELTELVHALRGGFRPDKAMKDLYLRSLNADGSVTRYELIATQLQTYPALLADSEAADGSSAFDGTFQDVLGDYRETVDSYLKEGGFQTLSEKNVFDLFVMLSLYFYLVRYYGMEA